MGDVLMEAAPSNPRGHFEDMELYRLNERVIGSWRSPCCGHICDSDLAEYARLIGNRNRHSVWGVKDPRLCITARRLLPLLQEARIVVTSRAFESSVRSLMARDNQTRDEASRIQRLYLRERDCLLHEFTGPRLWLSYDHLVESPPAAVKRLAEFAYEGRSLPAAERMAAAARFVDRTLRHH